jgi:hypothetical protein
MTPNNKLEKCKIILLSLIFVTVLYSTISTERELKKANRYGHSIMVDVFEQVELLKNIKN